MRTFELKIEMDNAAFDDDGGGNAVGEVARILRAYLAEADGGMLPERTLRDTNGNNVGKARVVEKSVRPAFGKLTRRIRAVR